MHFFLVHQKCHSRNAFQLRFFSSNRFKEGILQKHQEICGWLQFWCTEKNCERDRSLEDDTQKPFLRPTLVLYWVRSTGRFIVGRAIDGRAMKIVGRWGSLDAGQSSRDGMQFVQYTHTQLIMFKRKPSFWNCYQHYEQPKTKNFSSSDMNFPLDWIHSGINKNTSFSLCFPCFYIQPI